MRRRLISGLLLGGVCASVIAFQVPQEIALFSEAQNCVVVEEPAQVGWELTATEENLASAEELPPIPQAEELAECEVTRYSSLRALGGIGIGINAVAILIALAGLGWIIQILTEETRRRD